LSWKICLSLADHIAVPRHAGMACLHLSGSDFWHDWVKHLLLAREVLLRPRSKGIFTDA
jgi:hypothetical protein